MPLAVRSAAIDPLHQNQTTRRFFLLLSFHGVSFGAVALLMHHAMTPPIMGTMAAATSAGMGLAGTARFQNQTIVTVPPVPAIPELATLFMLFHSYIETMIAYGHVRLPALGPFRVEPVNMVVTGPFRRVRGDV